MNWGRLLRILAPFITISVGLVLAGAWIISHTIPGIGFGRALIFLWVGSLFILMGMGSRRKYR